MSATIRRNKKDYTVTTGLQWSGGNAGIVALLQRLTDVQFPHGTSPSMPDPARSAAKRAADIMGGKVTHADTVQHVKDRVY